jgi:hypothetical protein
MSLSRLSMFHQFRVDVAATEVAGEVPADVAAEVAAEVAATRDQTNLPAFLVQTNDPDF